MIDFMHVSVSSITIPPRITGDLHQKFAPTLGLLHPSLAIDNTLGFIRCSEFYMF